MKIVFSNIIKNTLPILIDTSISYEEYFASLTTSSKRFLNLSYRTFDKTVTAILDYNITKDELRYISDEGKLGLADYLISNSKQEFKPHWFVKCYVNKRMISYNHISLTKSDKITGYCNCFYIFDSKFSTKTFNTFSWFKFVELIIKANLADVIDLVVDRDLYEYIKIKNGVSYDLNLIKTSYSYLSERDKTVGRFNDKNSSKFLFLTKIDKARKESLLSVVCSCGHKNLLNLNKQKNVCYSCNITLSKLI